MREEEEAEEAEEKVMKSNGEESVLAAVATTKFTANKSRFAPLASILLLSLAILDNIQRTASNVIVVQPSSGIAALVYNQPLHFECAQLGNSRADFRW